MSMPALSELAAQLAGADRDPAQPWPQIHDRFRAWAGQPGLRRRLRSHLQDLPADAVAAVTSRSRETTTHFAWCLRDRIDEPFAFTRSSVWTAAYLAGLEPCDYSQFGFRRHAAQPNGRLNDGTTISLY